MSAHPNRHHHKSLETDLPTQNTEQKMPYYVVPVLYVPKRIVPSAESKTTSDASHTRHPGGDPKAASAPGRLQMRTKSSSSRSSKHHHQYATAGRHHISSKSSRSSPFCITTNLARVTEESEPEFAEDVIVPTRDVPDVPVKGGKLADGSKPSASSTSTDANTLATSKRDDTIHEVRIRLLEALEMVEVFQHDRKQFETKGTQCEHVTTIDDSGNRPFNHISRLEALLKQMRK